ncbi:rRNA-processing protein EFG1 [Wickerhamiella sorbophila]|uniref:rRNA-processing protein EFG1 n=1 Tax=Wickerhamiella sorbophila TaxID=45607 RepID=A0A2T0FIV3_9ASCO|nr:rRNA-processing protein EFG1 [Wickerhamiella sorbophila]PRT54869.1 rRNA-processing protein EFG1 [Wickerhamiella sorbophila]
MAIQSLPSGAGASKIRKRIRDLQRLLRKPGLSATKKVETERALASFEQDLEKVKTRNVEKKNAQKYHMVRFFDKKKAIRRLKHDGQEALADWYYVTTFPISEKYSALYAEGAAGHGHAYYQAILARIESGELEKSPEAVAKILNKIKPKKAS